MLQEGHDCDKIFIILPFFLQMTIGMLQEKPIKASAMRMFDIVFAFIFQATLTTDPVSGLSVLGAAMVVASVLVILFLKTDTPNDNPTTSPTPAPEALPLTFLPGLSEPLPTSKVLNAIVVNHLQVYASESPFLDVGQVYGVSLALSMDEHGRIRAQPTVFWDAGSLSL